MSGWKRLAARMDDLGNWRDADKCILASCLTLPFVSVWLLRLTLVRRNPALGPYLDQSFLGPMLAFVWLQAAGHLTIIAAGLLLRRRAARHPWLIALAIQFWFVCFTLDLYAIGPYTSPFGMLLLVFPVLGFIVFGVRPVTAGLVTFGLLLVASTLAERAGLIPYAPLFVASPLVDGRPHTSWILSLGAIPLFASAMILAIFAIVIAQWRDRERQLRELVKTDYLTEVHNRRSFMERAELEFSRACRHGKPLTIVMVDVDHFKRVNDEYGHSIGDEVLKLVAKILAAEVRRHDIVARYGGEEFVLLLAETDAAQARVMAERCRSSIESAKLLLYGSPVSVTASVGIADYPHEAVSRIEELVDRADQALYEAKQAGRNRVAVAA